MTATPSTTFSRALARDAPLAAVALGRSLRAAGLAVTPDRSATFARAAELVGVGERDRLYWAARLSFVTSRDHLAAFDAVFAAVVDGLSDDVAQAAGGDTAGPRARRPAARPVPSEAEPAAGGAPSG
ncbi:MAG: hypothetical protein HZB46_07190, partial [Solirubrobacterales bacterium]|nr:hypothetical protein [Solirubrobacterales bacterium]